MFVAQDVIFRNGWAVVLCLWRLNPDNTTAPGRCDATFSRHVVPSTCAAPDRPHVGLINAMAAGVFPSPPFVPSSSLKTADTFVECP